MGAEETVLMAYLKLGVHVSVWLAGQEWIVPLKFAAVAMEIAVSQTLVSAMKVGWAPSVRSRCSVRTLNAAIMAIANLANATVTAAGKGIFAIFHLVSVGTVLQVHRVIALLVPACAACRPAKRTRRRMMEEVVMAKAKA